MFAMAFYRCLESTACNGVWFVVIAFRVIGAEPLTCYISLMFRQTTEKVLLFTGLDKWRLLSGAM